MQHDTTQHLAPVHPDTPDDDRRQSLRAILDRSPVGVCVSRRHGGAVMFVNQRFAEMVGVAPLALVETPARQLYADDRQRREVAAVYHRTGSVRDLETRFVRADGTPFWALLTLAETTFEGHDAYLAWIYDVTKRRENEGKLRLAATVVETANEAIMITNSNNDVEFVNRAFTTITEYVAADVVGRNPRMLSSGRHNVVLYREMWSSLHRTGAWQGEIWNRRKSGESYAQWTSIAVLRDEAGAITHHVALFYDITQQKEEDEKIRRLVNYDALTGLPNRSLLADRLEQTVRHAHHTKGRFAVMFLDLDGFKAVNDQLGHAVGDLLLQETGWRLVSAVGPEDTVARLSGDEFVIVLQDIVDTAAVAATAAHILDRLAEPFVFDQGTGHVRGSLGIAMFPDNAVDPDDLLRLADAAMYQVKGRGKGSFHIVGED